MAFMNPSLNKNQEIITNFGGNIVKILTNDHVIDALWCQSIFIVFPS